MSPSLHSIFNSPTFLSGSTAGTDNNDRFVSVKCAGYLYRHAARYAFHEKEFLEVLCWVLENDTRHLTKMVFEQLPRQQKSSFKETAFDFSADCDDQARNINDMLSKLRGNKLSVVRKNILKLLECKVADLRYEGEADIEKKTKKLKKMFSLTDSEYEFCILLYIITSFEKPETLFVSHLRCNHFIGRKYLGNFLGIGQHTLERVLMGTLKKIELYESSRYSLEMTEGFLGLLENAEDSNFTSKFFTEAAPSTVPLQHHFIKDEVTEHLAGILAGDQKVPTHILLYGPPGTGKTSFALGIAEKANMPCYKIQQGDENTTKTRRAGILACINMTENNPEGSLILVDEADNLLNTRGGWFMRGETQDQGWLNQLLEKPGIRIIWITNRIDGIEESVLRRFSFSLHFKQFNRKQRIELWDRISRLNKAKRFFSRDAIQLYASKYKLSAGIIELELKKALAITYKRKKEFHRALSLGLDSHNLLKNGGKAQQKFDSLEKNYSIDGLNINGDITQILEQLERFDSYSREHEDEQRLHMNLLFYGQPGTGKSELARYIAKHLDREIICKRASDILDPYVGMTERNLSNAFAEAQAEEAILVIDEADTLLFSRDQASRSWEISFTNEFLTQVEHYKGILICTTNRFDSLDSASIRRFNFKIEFDFLKPEGVLALYRNLLGDLLKSQLDREEIIKLKAISYLTPGDFKTVRDKFRFYPNNQVNHTLFIDALKAEVAHKNRNSGKDKTYGFTT